MVKYNKMESSKLMSEGEERKYCGCGCKLFLAVFITILLMGIFFYWRPNYLFEIENVWNPGKENNNNRTANNSQNDRNKYNFLMNPKHLCQTSIQMRHSGSSKDHTKVKVVILLTSSLGNHDLRQAIRETWGSLARRPEAPFRLAFLVGTSPWNKTVTNSIEKENRLYKDIIQPDIPDNAQNHTTKSALLLRWAADYCTEAEFVLKSDDSIFIDVGYLLKILLNDKKYKSDRPFIGGYLGETTQIPQNTEKKDDQIKKNNQTERNLLLATGPTLVIKKGAVEPLYEMTLERHSDLPFDDILLSNAGIHAFEDTRFQKHPPPQKWPEFKGSVCAYGYNPYEMHSLWQQLSEDAVLYSLLQNMNNYPRDFEMHC